MGTRSITQVLSEEGKPIVTMYRQMDGYLSGHGKELRYGFGEYDIINGISGGDNENKANGMGCFAAQVIAHFKEGIGNIYLVPNPKQREEYNYILSCKEYKIWVKVLGYDGNGLIYDGWLNEMPIIDED